MSRQTVDYWSQHRISDGEYASHAQQHACSPCPLVPLPDVVHRPAAGEPSNSDKKQREAEAKRSLSEVQLEMYNKGAFFFDFEQPSTAPNGEPIQEDELYQKGVADYRTMEQRGFLVTTDGCIMPHEHFGVKGSGSGLKGYQRATFFLTGMMPEKIATGKKGKRSNKVTRDADGWPVDSHLEHLCHRNGCVRGDHLQIEPRAVSLRRNYCGVLGKGGCDCGMAPPCLHKFHPPEFEDPQLKYCKTRQEVLEVLGPLKGKFPFKLLDRERVRVDAVKAENDRKRKAAGKKTLAKTERKLKRKRFDEADPEEAKASKS